MCTPAMQLALQGLPASPGMGERTGTAGGPPMGPVAREQQVEREMWLDEAAKLYQQRDLASIVHPPGAADREVSYFGRDLKLNKGGRAAVPVPNYMMAPNNMPAPMPSYQPGGPSRERGGFEYDPLIDTEWSDSQPQPNRFDRFPNVGPRIIDGVEQQYFYLGAPRRQPELIVPDLPTDPAGAEFNDWGPVYTLPRGT